MSTLSVLVVDDELIARRRIIRLLNKMAWIEQVDEAGDVARACEMIERHNPDILLLDIQMPGGDGFKILENIIHQLPAVVFVTAFDHHALRAFEANAIDYVTKPIEAGRFYNAMERARNAAISNINSEKIAELQETISSLRLQIGGQDRRSGAFWIKKNGEYIKLSVDSVVRFQADRDYVRIYANGDEYIYHESLASLENRLDSAKFVRIHRGSIVRRSAIVRIKTAPFASLIVVLCDGSEARVGRTYTPLMRASIS